MRTPRPVTYLSRLLRGGRCPCEYTGAEYELYYKYLQGVRRFVSSYPTVQEYRHVRLTLKLCNLGY